MRSLILFCFPFVLFACSSPCDKATEALVAAGELPGDKKAELADLCEQSTALNAEEKAQTDQLATCAGKTGDEVKSCVNTVIVGAQIADARKSGDWGTAMRACKERTGVAECPTAGKEALDALMKKMMELRDKGEDGVVLGLDAEAAAAVVGGDAPDRVKTARAELAAGETAAKAIRDATENIAAKKIDLPLYCGIAIESLNEIGSEWAKGRSKEVAQTCYGDLGKVILAAEVPKMQYVCDVNVQYVYDGAKAAGLTDPELLAALAPADALCAKK